jgi:hypothetical protein
MNEPVKLPKRNWTQEAHTVIAKDHPCSYCEEAADHAHSNVQRGYRQACGGCCANHGGLTVDKHHAYDWVQSCLDKKNARIVRECAARLEAESRVAELTRQVESLKRQLQGATANEQSVVNEEAHDRNELAQVVQQKDALSVANHTLRKALHMAQSELDYEYQTLCSSFCPPCKQGDPYDYSELSPAERADIDRVEAALDAVDAALADAPAVATPLSVANQKLREKGQALLDDDDRRNPEDRCERCRAAKKGAYSDATTPGFFFDKCETHRLRDALRKTITDTQAGKDGS